MSGDALETARVEAIAALRVLAAAADAAALRAASVPVDAAGYRRARALRNIAHRCTGQILLHGDRA